MTKFKILSIIIILGLGSTSSYSQDFSPFSYNAEELALSIIKLYPRTSLEDARRISSSSIKFEDPIFPTRLDIISIIAVESKFNCRAVSGGNYGCMQINRRVWRTTFKSEVFTRTENNINAGSIILRKYHNSLNTRDSTIIAYNIGITAYQRGVRNLRYLTKVNTEYNNFKDILTQRSKYD